MLAMLPMLLAVESGSQPSANMLPLAPIMPAVKRSFEVVFSDKVDVLLVVSELIASEDNNCCH